MSDPGSWYEGLSPEQRSTADEVVRLLAWGVHVAGSVGPEFCQAVLDGCRSALEADPGLTALVVHAHDVADRETSREFTAHGPTTRARLWAGLGDRLEQLPGMDGIGRR